MREGKRKSELILLIFFTLIAACDPIDGQHKGKPNGLINESSPYLLQHAYNPVDWQPWKEKTLQMASDKDKLMIVSIGYAACHWCHVMEKESFSDSAVAAVMNENFVSVKVDREERPDVDQVYMDAALLMNGRGGWPLNVIALPDGKPIYAGTYFPKDNWVQVLDYFRDAYLNEKDKLLEQGAKVTEGVASMELIDLNLDSSAYDPLMLHGFFDKMLVDIDLRKGGRKGAPKFPTPIVFETLLLAHYHTGDQKTLDAVTTTLDQMANGGIYDHLGGGFARYSTDAIWKVPHFEKMLYDNAQLISLYSHAYQVTKKEDYRRVVNETVAFINDNLRDRNGGYYSSLDADSEGEEGKYYVWSEKEIDEVLDDQSKVFKTFYQVTTNGNWEEGKNILYKRHTDIESLSKKLNLSVEALQEQIKEGRKKLLKARTKRIAPPLDNKILTSWNAMTVKGLVDAYLAFGDRNFLNHALKTGEFIVENQIRPDGGLNRNYKDGQSSINAFLDDYSFSIEAFIKLYQVTFDEKWLKTADDLMSYAKAHFMDQDTRMFYYTSSSDDPLIARKMELADNVIPASNSSLAHGLFQLGHYYYRDPDIKQARQMLSNLLGQLEESPYYYSNWISLYAKLAHPFYEVAIVGEEAREKRDQLFQSYVPNAIIIGGRDEGSLELLENKLVQGRTMIYVCENKTCRLPVREAAKALPLIERAAFQKPTTSD